MTIGTGKFLGILGNSSLKAIGPPVEEAIATISFLPAEKAPVNTVCFFGKSTLFLTLATLAAKTLLIISSESSLMFSEIEPEGLAMKSTQPSDNALSVVSAPSLVKALSIMTGSGLDFMISVRALMPSILGISTSIVTTSGLRVLIWESASLPSLAVPTTSILLSALKISLMNCLIKALSSTTKTLIFFT